LTFVGELNSRKRVIFAVGVNTTKTELSKKTERGTVGGKKKDCVYRWIPNPNAKKRGWWRTAPSNGI